MAANGRGRVDAGYFSMEFDPPMATIEDDLVAIGRDLSNMRTPLRTSIQQVIIPSINANFEAGGRPEQWEPHTRETVLRREREGTGEKVLVETGRLQQAATQFARWNVDTDSAQISNWPADVIVRGAVHQMGTEEAGQAHNIKIPARPFLMLQDEDADKVEAIFLTWMELRARGRWTKAGGVAGA